MNYQLFGSLNSLEATELLEVFLDAGRANAGGMGAAARAAVTADYSVSSVSGVLTWLLSMVRKVDRTERGAVPDWIRSTEPYRSDLFDFDDPSRDLILQGAFYLGAC